MISICISILIVLAAIKGYRQGLIVAIFSIVAFIIGLAAAIKTFNCCCGYIGSAVKVSEKWLPIISFAIVFLIVVLLVRLGAKLIQKGVEFAMLGLVNSLAGFYYMYYYIFLFLASFYFMRSN